MAINSSDINNLEKAVSNFEKLLIIVGIVTTIIAVVVWYYKSQLTNLQKKELEQLTLQVANANERAETAIAQQKKLESTILALQIELQKEKNNRIELKEALSPRRIGDQYLPFIPLRKYKGMHAEILTEDDPDAKEFAKDLNFCLQNVGWKTEIIDSRSPLPNGKRYPIPDGIHVSSGIGRSKQSKYARDNLVSILRSLNFKVNRGGPPLNIIIPKSIMISVGKNPNYYFLPKEIKVMREKADKLRRESEENGEMSIDKYKEKSKKR